MAQYALPKKQPMTAGAPEPSPSSAAAHALLDMPAGEALAKFAPQFASKLPPEKANASVRELLKTSDFMTKGLVMSVLRPYLPKGVTPDDLAKAVNEPSPATDKPAATAAAPAAPAAAAAAAPAAAVAPAAAASAAAPAAPTAAAAARTQLTPELMRAIMKIESGGNPNARTGSYKGLYQLSDSEFNRLGGRGNIFDPKENERIATLKLQQEADQVSKRLGRALTPGEVYLVHQQGVGGAYEHLTNPGRPAWQSMHATGEGRNKGEKWSRLAIWGNVPDKDKARYGSVENLTSGEFAKMWSDRIARGGGGSGGSGEPVAKLPAAPAIGDAAGSPAEGGVPEQGSASPYDRATVASAAAPLDPTPNVGSGASDYETPSAVASTLGKDQFASAKDAVGDTFASLGELFAKGPVAQNAARPTGSGLIPMPLNTPSGVVPTVDPRMADMQRQQLALAMQRLNSGKLF